MTVIVKRLKENKFGTFGTLSLNGKQICVTLELPWNGNQPFISCIPAGEYECRPHNGKLYKNVWVLQDVPNRTGILIHEGNWKKNTTGCILVGTGFTENGISESVKALNLLRSVLPDEFRIKIENVGYCE